MSEGLLGAIQRHPTATRLIALVVAFALFLGVLMVIT